MHVHNHTCRSKITTWDFLYRCTAPTGSRYFCAEHMPPAMSYSADDVGVVSSCGDCCLPGAEGLSCRINQSVVVQASWDEERRSLCCTAPKDCCTPNLSYEVLDASGHIVCKSEDCCKDKINSACAKSTARTCEKASILGTYPASSKSLKDATALPDPLSIDDSPRDTAPNHHAAAAATSAAATAGGSVLGGLSWIDRLLPVWIVAAMVIGVLLGYFVPQVGPALAVAEIGGVSLPIALGLWIMMLPVLTKVRYELLGVLLRDKSVAKQFAVSAALNWLLGPALMTGLAWACLPDLPGFRNGVIMVGLARCIAMVLIWNDLAKGHPDLCAVMVAFNSILQIVLYAPLSLFYLQVVSGAAGVTVGFWPVAKSVLLFLGVPLLAGILLRYTLLLFKPRSWFDGKFMPYFGPWALIGLLYTIIVMFASQGANIIHQIGSVARVAVPMLVYFNVMFFASLGISHKLNMGYQFSVTQAFTAASNNFELAIAVAVGTFGIQSQEALAATVGPLIEVPVLLALVYVALWLKNKWWSQSRD